MTSETFKNALLAKAEEKKSHYKTELLSAIDFIDNQLEEMGSYGEEREEQKKAIELLLEFINNRI